MNLLFICTHNRCRSILAEAITNHLGKGALEARSAGSHPAGEVHPWTLKALRERGIATAGLRSKSWDEVTDPVPDVVITVCDAAAGEACPLWLGEAVKVHWGLPDPSKHEGGEAEIHAAFEPVIATLELRIRKLLMLEPKSLSKAALRDALNDMAREVDHGTL